ncbi:MAG: hypothetical protein QOG53_537 [Frankiales bacterium]|jgi:hypothetical protein|nr:hypothetical protein [Frankiales bacterium]
MGAGRFAIVAVAAAALLGTSACGHESSKSDFEKVSGYPLKPFPTTGSGATPAEKLVAIPWLFDGVKITNNHRRLEIGLNQSPCSAAGFDHVEVQEWTPRIVVTMWGVATPRKPNQLCVASLIIRLGYVDLTDPVGGRQILDGAWAAPK